MFNEGKKQEKLQLHGIIGTTAAGPILFDVFSHLNKGKDWFDPPYDELIEMTVCKESGFRNTPKCTAVDTVLAHRNALRSPSCHFYEIILTDEKERYRYHRGCSGNKKLHSRSRFVLPPLQAYFYKKNHADYQSLPPYHPNCVNYTTEATFTIVYPKHKSEIIGTVDLDGSQQPIVFEATHANSDATLFWHVD